VRQLIGRFGLVALALALASAGCASDASDREGVSGTTSLPSGTTVLPSPTTAPLASGAQGTVGDFTIINSTESQRQIEYEAVASATTADFAAEAVACANTGKSIDNERYCYLYPTLAALKDKEPGDRVSLCWVARAGSGIGTARATEAKVIDRSTYDAYECPPY
jgi:hypothetical protein